MKDTKSNKNKTLIINSDKDVISKNDANPFKDAYSTKARCTPNTIFRRVFRCNFFAHQGRKIVPFYQCDVKSDQICV